MSRLTPITLEEAQRGAEAILVKVHDVWISHIVARHAALHTWPRLEVPIQKAVDLLSAATRLSVGQGAEETRAIALLLLRYQRHLDTEQGRVQATEAPQTSGSPTPSGTDGHVGGCPGVDAVVELRRPPTTLVDCPHCGRRGLGGVGVSRLEGEGTARVPYHRPAKPRPEQTPQARFGEHWETVSDAMKILDRQRGGR